MIPFGQKIELHGVDFLRERKIQGSLMGSNRFRVDMPRLVDFYMAGKLQLDDLISGRIKLDQVNEGFDEMKTGKVVRSVIQFSSARLGVEQPPRRLCPLQRLDRDLAEFDHAVSVGDFGPSANRPLWSSAGFSAVEDDGDLPSLGGDLEGVPFAAGLGHRVHLGEVHDPARAIGRVLALVEDVHLIAGPVGDLGGLLAAKEDAAVGVVACPELGVDLGVLVFGLADQMPAIWPARLSATIAPSSTRQLVSPTRSHSSPMVLPSNSETQPGPVWPVASGAA